MKKLIYSKVFNFTLNLILSIFLIASPIISTYAFAQKNTEEAIYFLLFGIFIFMINTNKITWKN